MSSFSINHPTIGIPNFDPSVSKANLKTQHYLDGLYNPFINDKIGDGDGWCMIVLPTLSMF
jgi:hypothetical protein